MTSSISAWRAAPILSRRRIVIDTSTLVGAMLRTQSLPHRLLTYVLNNFSLFASEATLSELAEVAKRDSFNKYQPLAARHEFFQNYAVRVAMVTPLMKVTDCRDPKDNKFLELALHIQADVLVTSDDDLLTLNPWRGIAVLSPADFMIWTETSILL